MGLVFKLAIRNVLRNRRRSFLTILSMGVGYALLAFMLSLSEGSYNEMIDLFTGDHTGHVQIHNRDYLHRPSLYKTIEDSASLISDLQRFQQVEGVAPRIYGPSLAYGVDKSSPVQVVGIDPLMEASTTLLADKVTVGKYLSEFKGFTENGYFPVMVGQVLAKHLNLALGDELVFISQGIDGSIANDVFEVVGVVGTDTSYERMNAYLPLPAMQQFLAMGGQVHELAIRLKHHRVAQDFVETLAQQTQMAEQIRAQALNIAPWQLVEAAFYKSMTLDKKGTYISMGILIFLVSIGVLNTILMSMLERTREFGVLSAIGTRPRRIFQLIVLESSVLAVVGCLIGVVLATPLNIWLAKVGIVLAEPIDMGGISFSVMRGEVSRFVFGLPAVVVFFSTLAVSLIPAIRAARISPLEAMQSI